MFTTFIYKKEFEANKYIFESKLYLYKTKCETAI